MYSYIYIFLYLPKCISHPHTACVWSKNVCVHLAWANSHILTVPSPEDVTRWDPWGWKCKSDSLNIWKDKYIYIYIHTNIYTYIYMYIYICVYIYVYIYIHSYIIIHWKTYIHLHIYMFLWYLYVYVYKYIYIWYMFELIQTYCIHIFIYVHKYGEW
jgi:hypothetical protein